MTKNSPTPKDATAEAIHKQLASMGLDNLVEQIRHIVATLYTGNGQEAILPRFSRMETEIKETRVAITEAAKSDTALQEKLDALITNINDLAKMMADLAKTVNDHQKTQHFGDFIKNPKFYFLTFAIFLIYHSAATYLDAKGVSWIDTVLKWLGA